MLEKISRAAEAAVSGIGPTRRAFIGGLARLAGGAALGIAALAARPAQAATNPYCARNCLIHGRPCYCYVPGLCCNGDAYCLRYRTALCNRQL
jgi:hypothetical protein